MGTVINVEYTIAHLESLTQRGVAVTILQMLQNGIVTEDEARELLLVQYTDTSG